MKTEKYTVERHLDDQGRLKSETWWLHDQLNRLDGPAITLYRPDGTVEIEKWWFQGQLLTPEQHAAQTQPTDCVLDTIVEHNGKKYRLVPVDSP